MEGLVRDLQALMPFFSTNPDVVVEQYKMWCGDLTRYANHANLHIFFDKKHAWYFALGNNPKEPGDRLAYVIGSVAHVFRDGDTTYFKLYYTVHDAQCEIACYDFIDRLAEMFPKREKKPDASLDAIIIRITSLDACGITLEQRWKLRLAGTKKRLMNK